MSVKNYMVIDGSGTVVNSVSWDGVTPWTPPPGTILVQSDTAGVGWKYQNGVFTPPA